MGLLSDDRETFDNAFSMVKADRCGVALRFSMAWRWMSLYKINKRLRSRKSFACNVQTQGPGEKPAPRGAGLDLEASEKLAGLDRRGGCPGVNSVCAGSLRRGESAVVGELTSCSDRGRAVEPRVRVTELQLCGFRRKQIPPRFAPRDDKFLGRDNDSRRLHGRLAGRRRECLPLFRGRRSLRGRRRQRAEGSGW